MSPQISKGPPSSSVADYRLISITSVLCKVFEHLVSVHLGRFMEQSGVLQTTQFAYWKGALERAPFSKKKQLQDHAY